MLIGLNGPAQSGKDTIYSLIQAMNFDGPLSDYLVRRDAFADRLKISAARALGYDGDDPIGFCNLLKEPGMWVVSEHETSFRGTVITGREYLQRYGTEAHREVFGKDFWTKAVLPDGYPSQVEQEKTLLVVTDVRFDNEAERIRECGGQVVKVVRDHEKIEESEHASEQELPGELIDYVLDNTGTLADLAVAVETLVVDVLKDQGQ